MEEERNNGHTRAEADAADYRWQAYTALQGDDFGRAEVMALLAISRSIDALFELTPDEEDEE
jgi:hypothetical protein